MITSIKNERIKKIRDLLSSRHYREEQKLFVVEGVRLVEEAFQANCTPCEVLYTQSLSQRGLNLVERWSKNNVICELISEDLLKRISDTEQSQGILAVLPSIDLAVPSRLDFIVILDAIQDPGNLGTIFRTAAAGSVQLIILAPGCADPYSPKVLRSGMGAHFHIPFLMREWTEIEKMLKIDHSDLKIITTDAKAQNSVWETNFAQPVALVIGSEARGVCEEARQLEHASIKIPMCGNSESLNAAVSAGILIFETIRQRSSS